MEKKPKILLIIIIIGVILSVSYTFYLTIIKNDFQLVNLPGDSSSTDAGIPN